MITCSFVPRIFEIGAGICIGETNSSWGFKEEKICLCRSCYDIIFSVAGLGQTNFSHLFLWPNSMPLKIKGFKFPSVRSQDEDTSYLYSMSTCSCRGMNLSCWFGTARFPQTLRMRQMSSLVLQSQIILRSKGGSPWTSGRQIKSNQS